MDYFNLFLILLVINIVIFLLYGIDKFCAVKSFGRIPERTLHLLALLGGTPGAFLGQIVFSHKTSKRSFQVVFWLVFIIQLAVIVTLFVNVGKASAEIESLKSHAGSIIVLLKQEQILDKRQRNHLDLHISQFVDQEKNIHVLEDVAIALSEKIQHDIDDLDDLMFFLNELNGNKYVRNIAKVRLHDMRRLRHRLKRLKKNSEKIYLRSKRDRSKMTTRDYAKVIQKDAGIITGRMRQMTVPRMWEAIDEYVHPIYFDWSAHYKTMKDDYRGKSVIDLDEVRFIKDFPRFQAMLRRLSNEDSSEF